MESRISLTKGYAIIGIDTKGRKVKLTTSEVQTLDVIIRYGLSNVTARQLSKIMQKESIEVAKPLCTLVRKKLLSSFRQRPESRYTPKSVGHYSLNGIVSIF